MRRVQRLQRWAIRLEMDLQRYAKQSTRKQPMVQIRKATLIDPKETFNISWDSANFCYRVVYLMRVTWVFLLLVLASENVMAIDLDELWDFRNPELSEQRFTAALKEASEDQALIIQTQIARTYSMRRDYDTARKVLSQLDKSLHASSDEVRVRYSLELGCTYVSAGRVKESLDTGTLEKARSLYLESFELAKTQNLDGLAVDALHMMAFVDTEPEDQLI